MLKKTIKFEDLDGNPVTKDYYFHLSKAELVRYNMQKMTLLEGGEPDVEAFKADLDRIIHSKSGKVIMDTFEDIVRMSYGERDEDNITFHKSPELSTRFMNTNAYGVLFLELCTNAGAAGEFINGIIPKGLDEEHPLVDRNIAFPEVPKTPLGLVKDPDEMSIDELKAALAARTAQGGGQ